METERTESASSRRRNRTRVARKPRPEIHYTQPKPFFRNRLLVQLLSMAAVVLAVTVGVSIFFKVDTVAVAGADKYTADIIAQASQIRQGESLIFFGRARAASRIKKELPYVDTVQFRLQLPDTVTIIVEEKLVSSALQGTDGSWWMVTADGLVAEKTTADGAKHCPQIIGVHLQDPKAGAKAVAAKESADPAVVTTAADRLNAALKLMQALELCQFFAPENHIDVSDLFALRLYCGSNYRVELGDSTALQEKIWAVRSALSELGDRGGVLKPVFNESANEGAGEWEVLHQNWSQS